MTTDTNDKEIETLNLYIEQQQSKIGNLMSTIVILETKVAYLENEMSKIDKKHQEEIEKLNSINRGYRDQILSLSSRPILSKKGSNKGTSTKTITGFDIKGEYESKKGKRKGIRQSADTTGEKSTTILSEKIVQDRLVPVRKALSRDSSLTNSRIKPVIPVIEEKPIPPPPVRTGLSKGSKTKRN
jgi:hypothetical protein